MIKHYLCVNFAEVSTMNSSSKLHQNQTLSYWIYFRNHHYSDVIMGAMAFQITSLMIVYLAVYSGADQIKHQSSASLAFVRGIHRWPHKLSVTRKSLYLMTSSWWKYFIFIISHREWMDWWIDRWWMYKRGRYRCKKNGGSMERQSDFVRELLISLI